MKRFIHISVFYELLFTDKMKTRNKDIRPHVICQTDIYSLNQFKDGMLLCRVTEEHHPET